jgi:SAM-dependent methyltransferase
VTDTDDRTRELLAASHQRDEESWAYVERSRRDADAEIYETFFTTFQTTVELLAYERNFAGLSNADLTIEVGCGTGRTISALPGNQKVGLNLARGELEIARQRLGPDVWLVQASATHLPFKDHVFDGALCAGVLHHIPGNAQRAAVIREIKRITKPRSRVVLALHSYSWVVQRMFPHEMVYHDLFWHRFSPAELRTLLKDIFGRSSIHVEGICHLPRWRVGNRLGKAGVQLDRFLSRLPGLAQFSGAILVARVDRG